MGKLKTEMANALKNISTSSEVLGKETKAKTYEAFNNLYGVSVVSAKAVLVGGAEVEIVDNALTLTVGDVLDYVVAEVNTAVVLEGTPKSIVTIGGQEYDHGLVTVDSVNKKLVKVTPTGTNGTVGTAGEFPIKVLANSVKSAVDVGNAQIVITLTAVEAE